MDKSLNAAQKWYKMYFDKSLPNICTFKPCKYVHLSRSPTLKVNQEKEHETKIKIITKNGRSVPDSRNYVAHNEHWWRRYTEHCTNRLGLSGFESRKDAKNDGTLTEPIEMNQETHARNGDKCRVQPCEQKTDDKNTGEEDSVETRFGRT